MTARGDWRTTGTGLSLPVMVAKCTGQIQWNRWSMQMTGQVECKRVIKWSAILHTMERRSVDDTTRGMPVVLGTHGCAFVRNVIEALAPIHELLIRDTLKVIRRSGVSIQWPFRPRSCNGYRLPFRPAIPLPHLSAALDQLRRHELRQDRARHHIHHRLRRLSLVCMQLTALHENTPVRTAHD